MQQLAKRVLTAVAFVAILLVAFFLLPIWGAVGVIALLLLLAAWEWTGFLGQPPAWQRVTFMVIGTGLVLIASLWMGGADNATTLGAIAMLWWVVAFVWITRYPTEIGAVTAWVSGYLVLVPAGASIMWLLTRDSGPVLVLIMLVIVWAADIGAYFVGRAVGRVKLAPQVSPGKTWEGVIGGLAAATLAAIVAAGWAGLTIAQGVGLGISVAAISVIGDLTVSMFKRNAGLKDSGRLFPGHGGVLDRIDGVTAAAPLFAIEATWLGMIV